MENTQILEKTTPTSLDYTGTTSHLEDKKHRTITLFCCKCGHYIQVKLKCSDRTCPECRRRTYFKLFKGWIKLVENMNHPKLLTLTIKNRNLLTKEDIKATRNSFNKLLRRKYYKDRITGGLYVLEITNKGKGWHIHIHAIIDTISGKEGILPQDKLSKDWLNITGDSKIVDIKKAHNTKGALSYILKYFIKPPQVDGKEYIYNLVLKGSRLIQTFGKLYGEKPEKIKLKCENCGGALWISEFDMCKRPRSYRNMKDNIKTIVR